MLPPAQERPLGVGLGAPVSAEQARRELSAPVALPPLSEQPQLYLDHGRGVGAPRRRRAGAPLGDAGRRGRPGDPEEGRRPLDGRFRRAGRRLRGHLDLRRGARLHLSGRPPRLAGNVLLWERDGILYRLEGRGARARSRRCDLAARSMEPEQCRQVYEVRQRLFRKGDRPMRLAVLDRRLVRPSRHRRGRRDRPLAAGRRAAPSACAEVSYVHGRSTGASTTLSKRVEGKVVARTTLAGELGRADGDARTGRRGGLSLERPDARPRQTTCTRTGSSARRFALRRCRHARACGSSARSRCAATTRFDALSPQGRWLYLIHHLQSPSGTRYQVQGLRPPRRKRSSPRVIADKRQAGWLMAGLPRSTRDEPRTGAGSTRSTSRSNNYPFVHALDTVEPHRGLHRHSRGSGPARRRGWRSARRSSRSTAASS